MGREEVMLSPEQWTEVLGHLPPPDWPRRVAGVQPDSRRVRSGDVFVAIEGSEGDGHRFVTDAVRKGAVAVVGGHDPRVRTGVPFVRVEDPRMVLARISRLLTGCADERLRITGVTGTNGKTSVTGYVHQLLSALGVEAGLLGTVAYRFAGREIPARRTTPGAPDLHQYLRSMAQAGCSDCVMEISSHALDQKRVAELNIHTAVFTNLTQDHLDYHPDLESYFQAKAGLFRYPSVKRRIAGEDTHSRRLAEEFPGEVQLCGLGSDCQVRAVDLKPSLRGTSGRIISPWGEGALQLPQPGEFNVRNLLQAVAVVAGYGFPLTDILARVPELKAAPGRLQEIPSGKGKVFVDYAHTPDALANIVKLFRPLCEGRLVVLFGCGGDRDRGKRKGMVRAAGEVADELVLTTDNPRTEDPEQIFTDMEQGLEPGITHRIVSDRKQAIFSAVKNLGADDVLLIAGKGHETVQEIGALQLPFDDRAVAVEAIRERDLSQSGVC